MADLRTDTCECGNKLNYKTTIIMRPEQRVCSKCGRIHYVEDSPMDWERLKESMRSE